jgi:hypothetical protein
MEIREYLEDDHVHMALIVAIDGRLITTIERPDLEMAMVDTAALAQGVGTLEGRTISPSHDLATVTAALVRERRRRLAVVDTGGHLLGLLCLKRNGTGYCTDEGIRSRAAGALSQRACCQGLGAGRRE